MNPRPWLGGFFVVLGALGFAVGVVLTPFVYDSGTDPATLVMARAGGYALLLYLALRLFRRPRALPPAVRYKALLLGGVFAVQSMCFFTSITLIPVSVAAISEYTFPLQVALVSWALYGQRIGLAKALCFPAAFAGLWMALQVSGEGVIDPRGVALAVVGSMLLTFMVMFGDRIMGAADSRRVTLHTTATVAVLYAALFLVTELQPSWPQTALGWGAMAASSLTYLTGMLGIFTGIAMIGPTRASILMNLEPIFTLALAMPILGEVLNPIQLAGAALVIGAVVASQVLGRMRRPPA
ncbi:MAG: DMT family transporter [Proteobacteria bacterium]|nr:DMT family transporter [Pseudomonadota bacterium]